MAFSSGSHLGPYEILEPLGKGGMGEVYRARDTKLGRDVAIKVLPEDHARDADRVARFQREAQVLASLNRYCPRSLRTTTPPFITNFTRSISVTSVSGFPETAMTSANLPFSSVPNWLAQL